MKTAIVIAIAIIVLHALPGCASTPQGDAHNPYADLDWGTKLMILGQQMKAHATPPPSDDPPRVRWIHCNAYNCWVQ